MEKQRGIALLPVLLIILGVEIIGVGAYFAYNKYYAPKEEVQAPKPVSQDETDSWSTYLNDQLNFTFKYPPGWTYEQTKWTDENWTAHRSFNLTFKPEDFGIEANPWSASMALTTHAFEGYEKVSTESVKVDTAEATKEVWETTAKGKELYKDDYKSIVYKITHDQDDITIYFNYKTASETDRYEKFTKLMKTFKFTKTTGETGEEEEIDELAGWKTYTNSKYGYSFKYPAEYTVGNSCPKPCKGQVNTLEGGNHTFMQGDISEVGWPMISISHYDTTFYNPTGKASLYTWLKKVAFGDTKENLPDGTTTVTTASGALEVVKVSIPASPQAYSRWEIYFMKNGKMFMITMLDVKTQAAKDFYTKWLTGFKK